MNINGEKININDLVSQKYMHKEIKKGIFLSDYQINVLSSYKIDVNSCSSINDILFQINEILEDDEDAYELENIEREISEFNYYANTNK